MFQRDTNYQYGFLGALILIILSGCSLTPQASTSPPPINVAPLDMSRLFEMEPAPELSPQDVVHIQIAALGQNNAEDEGIALTFKFASPSNKRFTGPLERFTRMIKSNYGLMLNYRKATFDEVIINGDEATQLVRLTDAEGIVVVFSFSLSKQTGDECTGCWMTDAVTIDEVYQSDDKQI